MCQAPVHVRASMHTCTGMHSYAAACTMTKLPEHPPLGCRADGKAIKEETHHRVDAQHARLQIAGCCLLAAFPAGTGAKLEIVTNAHACMASCTRSSDHLGYDLDYSTAQNCACMAISSIISPIDHQPTLDVIFFSAMSTTPSFARHPMAAPAFEMASIAYSTWYSRPSGLKIVVRLSYLRAMPGGQG